MCVRVCVFVRFLLWFVLNDIDGMAGWGSRESHEEGRAG